ncbi:MAG: hypothetical protein LBF72_03270 [Holosporales bacterium]|jgi:hypothetical protein|nr:hypothetical protein [Holosporales bacterium]
MNVKRLSMLLSCVAFGTLSGYADGETPDIGNQDAGNTVGDPYHEALFLDNIDFSHMGNTFILQKNQVQSELTRAAIGTTFIGDRLEPLLDLFRGIRTINANIERLRGFAPYFDGQYSEDLKASFNSTIADERASELSGICDAIIASRFDDRFDIEDLATRLHNILTTIVTEEIPLYQLNGDQFDKVKTEAVNLDLQHILFGGTIKDLEDTEYLCRGTITSLLDALDNAISEVRPVDGNWETANIWVDGANPAIVAGIGVALDGAVAQIRTIRTMIDGISFNGLRDAVFDEYGHLQNPDVSLVSMINRKDAEFRQEVEQRFAEVNSAVEQRFAEVNSVLAYLTPQVEAVRQYTR